MEVYATKLTGKGGGCMISGKGFVCIKVCSLC